MTVGEDLVLGLQTLVLGMVVTFIGLLILQGVMMLMARFAGANDRNGQAAKSIAVVASDGAAPEGAGAQASPTGRADEEAAAIAAVIALLTAENEAPTQAGLARSVVRPTATAANAWGLAGRQDIMAARRRA